MLGALGTVVVAHGTGVLNVERANVGVAQANMAANTQCRHVECRVAITTAPKRTLNSTHTPRALGVFNYLTLLGMRFMEIAL